MVISHFHGDHINGLLAADNKAAFANAEIMVPAAEWKFWMDDGEMSKGMGNPSSKAISRTSARVFDALGRKVTQYEPGKEVAPGITAVFSPGHTPGHNSFVVASGVGKVLVQVDITAGAAFFSCRTRNGTSPPTSTGPSPCRPGQKLYDMAIVEKMPIQAFHGAFPGLVRVEKAGDGYRWIPTIWNASL